MLGKKPLDIYDLMKDNYQFKYPLINGSIQKSIQEILIELTPITYNRKEKKQIKLSMDDCYEEQRWFENSVTLRVPCNVFLCEISAKIENAALIITTKLFPECDICKSKDVIFEEIHPIQIILTNNHIREFDYQCRCNQCKRIQLF